MIFPKYPFLFHKGLFSAMPLITLFSCSCYGSSIKQVEVPVSVDTTLFNLTTGEDMASSETLIVGRVNKSEGGEARALLKFEFAKHIPKGSEIQSVMIHFSVVAGNREDPVTLRFHRMLRPWSEDATWNTAVPPKGAWATPGGGSGQDFATAASGAAEVDSLNQYEITSNRKLIEDTQWWLDHPENNHGWIILSESEQIPQTSRRLASGNHSDRIGPRLLVTFKEVMTKE